MEDYPFEDWVNYFKALTLSLQGEYEDIYPEYAEFIYTVSTPINCPPDYILIKELLDYGLNPQEGLNGFIKAIVDGNRYGRELEEYFDWFIKLFKDKGANVSTADLSPIFKPLCDTDEAHELPLRAKLLDVLSRNGTLHVERRDVEAMSEEDVPVSNDWTEICYRVLKYHSMFLQNL